MGMHANDIGALATMVLAYNFGKEKLNFSKLDYLSLGSALVVIVLSFSRIAFIGTLVVFLLGFKKFTAKQKLSSIGLMVVVIMIFSPMLVKRISYGITEHKSSTYTKKNLDTNQISAGRIDTIWKPSLYMIRANPVFGQGILSIWKGKYITDKPIEKPATPHNAYLEVALDMGLFGIIFLVSLLRSMWKVSAGNKGFRYALIAWLIVALTASTFYPAFFVIPIFIYYAITCAQPREDLLAGKQFFTQ